jgi:diacylglycerol kinase family enzyme
VQQAGDQAAVLVVNPRAGSLAAMPQPRATLEAAMALAGFSIAAPMPEDTPLELQWRIALDSAAPLVFVAGGDGTLRDAAIRLRGTGRVLAPVPGGTMNRVVSRLGLPNDPVGAIAAHHHSIVHDVGMAEVNGEAFLHQCVVGRVTWLMRLREHGRGGGWRGWLRLLRGVLREALRPILARRLTVRLGPHRRTRAHTVVVTAPVRGEPPFLFLKVAPRLDPLVRMRQAWRWFRGRLGDDPDILVRRTTRFVLFASGGSVRLSVDGESRRATSPLRFRLVANQLRIYAPPVPDAPP